MQHVIGTLLEKVIETVVLKPLGDRYEKFLKARQTRADLEGAWSEARDKIFRENPLFDVLIDPAPLMEAVLEHALDPWWLRSPEEEAIRNSASLRWINDPRAFEAASKFLRYFIDIWKTTPSFSAIALLYEEIRGTEILQSIHEAIVAASKEIRNLKTSAAPRPGPSPALLDEYCRRLAAAPLKAFPYERTVTQKADRAKGGKPGDPIPLSQALKDYERLLLLGEGGLGKSVALRCRERELAGIHAGGADAPVPILLTLASYNGETIERLAADRFNGVLTGTGFYLSETAEESERAVRTWLTQGKGTVEVLFDGLNELPEKTAGEFWSRLQYFLLYSQRFVFAARDSAAGVQSTSPVEVFDLNPLAIADAAEIISRTLPGSALQSRFDSDPDFARLVQNPFFLELVLELPVASPQGALPQTRALLLREYVRSVPRAIRGEQGQLKGAAGRTGVVEAFLTELGWRTRREGVIAASFSDVESWVQSWLSSRPNFSLEELLRGASLFRHLRSDGSNGEPVEFRHQLLRDYFAAERIAAEFHKSRDLDRATESQFADPTWREPIRMTAGLLLADSTILVDWLLTSASKSYQTLDLAFDCWGDSDAKHDPAITSRLAAALRAHIEPPGKPDLVASADSVIEQLGELCDAAAVPLIREFMKRVGAGWAHYEAIPALEKIATREAFDALVEYLGSADEDTRRAATKALRGIGPPAIASLLRSRSGPVENILREIAPAGVRELVDGLADPDRAVRRLAVYALGSSRDPQAIHRLIPLLTRNEDNAVRAEVATSLGKLGNRAASSALVSAVEAEDENPSVKLEAAYSLWEQGWEIDLARAALLRIYREPGRQGIGKTQILNGLALRPDAGIVDLLLEACGDASKVVRGNAFSHLGDFPVNIETEKIDAFLVESMRNPLDDISTGAAYAMYGRYKQQALPRLVKVFDEDPGRRLGILDTIGRYYGEAGRAWLAILAESALDPAVRARAHERLSRFEDKSAPAS